MNDSASDSPTTNGSGEREIMEEELELVAYLDLS